MGLKDIEGTPAYAAAKNMYGFNMAADATMEERVMEAAARIYESGVRKVGDRVMAGHNNVRADFAAVAFDQVTLAAVQKQAFDADDAVLSGAAGIILERQHFIEDKAAFHLDRIHRTGEILHTIHAFPNRVPSA